jgi:hypothetical protein
VILLAAVRRALGMLGYLAGAACVAHIVGGYQRYVGYCGRWRVHLHLLYPSVGVGINGQNLVVLS